MNRVLAWSSLSVGLHVSLLLGVPAPQAPGTDGEALTLVYTLDVEPGDRGDGDVQDAAAVAVQETVPAPPAASELLSPPVKPAEPEPVVAKAPPAPPPEPPAPSEPVTDPLVPQPPEEPAAVEPLVAEQQPTPEPPATVPAPPQPVSPEPVAEIVEPTPEPAAPADTVALAPPVAMPPAAVETDPDPAQSASESAADATGNPSPGVAAGASAGDTEGLFEQAIRTLPPSLRSGAKPRYPRVARRRGWEGVVLLRVFVTTNGQIEEVQLEESSGYDVLDRAAEDAIQSWVFHPAQHGEAAVAGELLVPIRFDLVQTG